MARCKSGRHFWLDSQKESLEKCCNGWVRLTVPRTNLRPDETKLHPYDQQGWGSFVTILVHQSEVERIKRLRALEPGADRVDKNGAWVIN